MGNMYKPVGHKLLTKNQQAIAEQMAKRIHEQTHVGQHEATKCAMAYVLQFEK